jgi:glycosyltransferase involved in cell wall biosynthesis
MRSSVGHLNVHITNESGYDAPPLVSVVITTRNEETRIEDCIISVLEQTYPNFELIVVDAKSSDRTFEKLSRLAPRSSKNCRRYLYLSEDADSPARGRNIGVKIASGKIVAFTDGDCVAERDWLANLVAHIPKELGCVGGPNILCHARRSKILDAIDSVLGTYLGSGGSPQFLRIDEVCEVYAIPSCNFAIQKNLFDCIGGFDETLKSNEDSDLCNRIRERGYKVVYTPLAKVNHFMGLDSFSRLSNIMYKYGLETGKNTIHNPKLFQKFRILSVACLVVFLNLIVLSLFMKMALIAIIIVVCILFSIVAIASLKIGMQKRSSLLVLLSIPIFFSIFTFYNAGLLSGYLLGSYCYLRGNKKKIL